MSRAQIARETALSKPTVSQALSALFAAGLVREAGRTSGGKGPTALLYELNPRAGWVVGIDVGRDWVRAAIADVTGAFVARRDERAQVKSAKTLITQIGAVAHGLAADAGIEWRQVTSATVGSPGVFEPERGQVALAHALPGWGRQGLVELVQRELGTKIAFENDVNLAALGEQWQGLGKARSRLRLPPPRDRCRHGVGVERRAVSREHRRGGRGRLPAARGDRPSRAGEHPSRGARRRGERDGCGRGRSTIEDDRRRSPRRRCSMMPVEAVGRRSGWWPSRLGGSRSRSRR